MKKLAGIIVLMVFSLTGNAQVENIEFGARAGLNLSHLIMKDNFERVPTTARPNAMLGVFARKSISEQFSGQVELLYAGISGGIKGNEYSAPVNPRHNLHYLLLPVLTRYAINDKISLEAGPQVGYLLSAKRVQNSLGQLIPANAMNPTGGGANNPSSPTNSTDISDFYKNVDVAFVLGASYQILDPMSGFIRYQHGLTNLSILGIDGYVDRNIALSIGLTYLFKK
ncbi:hypothetical protein A33Q_2649 [Indibacter alkaliphilus LW1]|uniref:Outer membrane protein beta-barrel domain-containing protein n=1 Tax=Indibacter alkaliphilus (strain CCUG 57479 / KCTC 22604 / LW1) TaxID=1189612 RepID=S2DVJ3_INDAL|nr:porin family protein [Indibacter alkaliphilus]EOZ96056.1 hypothetical protein A33Q_2649 [Indibacter alkaliphilus LW1]